MKKFISCMVMLAMCISMFAGMINASELKFTDVSESDWYYNDVKTAVEMSLVNGKSETTYAPNDNLTYAEAIKLAACMHQLYNEGAVSFGTGDPWYQPYLDYCVKNKIIDKEYDYNAKATRAGYMGIFANALPEDGLKGINNVPDDSIPDVPSARAYAAGVYKLYRAGILTGVDAAHNCNPLANITRAEVAAILTRMMNADKRVKFDMGTGSTSNSGSSSSGSSSGGSSSGGSSSGGSKETSALKIKTDPKDVTVKVGNKAVFTVAAKGGTKPYSYQWMVLTEKDADPLEDEGEFIKGANTDELTLIPDEESETEVYCVITDAEGEEVESDIATLYCVKDKEEEKKEEATGLRIKTQPKSQTVGAKEAALFTVEVEGGKEPYTYQWQMVKSGSWENIVTSAFYNGVTTKTLKAIYTYDKEEHIRCVITDANGDTVETEKVTFLVEVNPALAIKTQPESVSATADTEVTFTVAVSGGKAPYTYKWQTNRNGGDFYDINSGTFNFHEGHDAATYELKISQTVLDNKHGFRCIITDANGDSVTSETATVTYEEELDNDDFEMTISEVIFINGKGIALTGKISEGKVNVGDTVYINDADNVRIAKTTVKGIEISNKALDEAKKGQTVGILVDLDVEEYKGKIVVGNILSASGGSLGERPAVSRPSTAVTRPTRELAITSQSEDMTGSIGIFDLSVEVSGGTAPYTYVWMKSEVVGNRNGTFTTKFIAIGDTEGKISGAKTANLKVSLTTLDTHEYKCMVTDADGNQVTSEVITITVDSESSSGRVSIPTSGKTGNLD